MKNLLKVTYILFLLFLLISCENRIEVAEKLWADGKHQDAINKLSEELDDNPSNIKAKELLQKYSSGISLQNARKLIELKNYDLAINLLEKEVQNFPNVNEFFYLLGNCYANKFYDSNNKEYKAKARKYYQSSIQINPEHFQSLFNLACLSQEKDDWEKLVSYQDNPNILRNLGIVSNNYDMIKKSITLVPIEGDYKKIYYKEKTKYGTCIVKKDKAIAYNTDGSESTMFEKYHICTYTKMENNKLLFYIEEPVKKIGWVRGDPGGLRPTSGLQEFNTWKKKKSRYNLEIYLTKSEAEKGKGKHFFFSWTGGLPIFRVSPFEVATEYRGKNLIIDSFEPIKEEGRAPGYALGRTRYTPLLKVSFLYIEPVLKYIKKNDVEIGRDSIKIDKERVKTLKSLVDNLNISNELVEKLLAGYIAPNYLEKMVLASIGKPKERKKVINDEGLSEEFIYKNDMSLLFKNGRLVSWMQATKDKTE